MINISNVAIRSEPTEKPRHSYEVTAATIRTATCLLDTGAGFDLVDSTDLPSKWTNHINRGKMAHIRTATQDPLRVEKKVIHYLCIGYLCVRVWFVIVHNFAVDILLGTTFINRFKLGVFPAKRIFVQSRYHPVAIILGMQCNQHTHKSTSHVGASLAKPSADDEANSHPVSIARQNRLKSHSEHSVLGTSTASDINNVKPKIFEETRQMTFAADDVIDVLPSQPFHILVNNFSAKVMLLPRYTMIAYAKGPPTSVMNSSSTIFQQFPMGTP